LAGGKSLCDNVSCEMMQRKPTKLCKIPDPKRDMGLAEILWTIFANRL
jgi:hypothetical protein